jgi:hypothetical protein
MVWLASPASLLAQAAPDAPGDPAAAAWPGEYIVVIDPAAGEVTAAQAQLAQAGGVGRPGHGVRLDECAAGLAAG